ncbi:MAG: hypothetical protein PUE27_10770 [Sharpea porci]|nr:hypothetical protein [Sharpea porci]MDD6712546.1 hypothetical protein [Sharpea porci]
MDINKSDNKKNAYDSLLKTMNIDLVENLPTDLPETTVELEGDADE